MWIRWGRCLGEDARDDRGDTVEDGGSLISGGAICISSEVTSLTSVLFSPIHSVPRLPVTAR
ncbi:hypothetical protein C3488_35985 [Streptomyces sp. Ru72]|nr:hypothetical protein C3488_35985 [Streptomyces sp. Ru72]